MPATTPRISQLATAFIGAQAYPSSRWRLRVGTYFGDLDLRSRSPFRKRHASAVSTCRLNISPEDSTLTPHAFQTNLVLVPLSGKSALLSPAPHGRRNRSNTKTFALPQTAIEGKTVSNLPNHQSANFVSGLVSNLDAFSCYRLARGCPAMPDQTTGKLEAPTGGSSRTNPALPSNSLHNQ